MGCRAIDNDDNNNNNNNETINYAMYAQLWNWFFMTPSISTKFQYINSL
jgi:hypothetical protein